MARRMAVSQIRKWTSVGTHDFRIGHPPRYIICPFSSSPSRTSSPPPLPPPSSPHPTSTMVSPTPTPTFNDPPNYSFPSHRFNRVLRDSSKTPIVLVACGSFSPVTYLHLRMFEMAKDYVRQNTDFEIVGGYLSPVSDQYKKPGLINAHHR